MSHQCAGITRNGGRCTVSVSGAQQFCHLHDPARSEERRRAASRAGRAKPGSREVVKLKAELGELKNDVLDGKVDRNRAAVAVQVFRTIVQVIELERRVRETDELSERIAELERSSSRTGGGRWTGRTG